MAKFNLFESQYNLVVAATRRPAEAKAPQPVKPFVIGVALWFVTVFGIGFMILAR